MAVPALWLAFTVPFCQRLGRGVRRVIAPAVFIAVEGLTGIGIENDDGGGVDEPQDARDPAIWQFPGVGVAVRRNDAGKFRGHGRSLGSAGHADEPRRGINKSPSTSLATSSLARAPCKLNVCDPMWLSSEKGEENPEEQRPTAERGDHPARPQDFRVRQFALQQPDVRFQLRGAGGKRVWLVHCVIQVVRALSTLVLRYYGVLQ